MLATSSPLDAATSLSVTCTNATPHTVSLNVGANVGANAGANVGANTGANTGANAGAHAGGGFNFASRMMKSGAHSMAYQLYLDSARASVWGDGSAGSATLAGVGAGSAQSLNIYGRIPSLTNVVPGSHSDMVTVTITY